MAFFLLTSGAHQAAAPAYPTDSVTLTGYNAVPWQTDGDPLITASGAYADPDVVAARSRDLADELPFGTVIAIEPVSGESDCGWGLVGDTVGYRVIADTMNARFTKSVDVLFATDNAVRVGGKEVNAATALGSCKDVTIRIVGHIDLTDPADLPKTQTALGALVGASGLALK